MLLCRVVAAAAHGYIQKYLWLFTIIIIFHLSLSLLTGCMADDGMVYAGEVGGKWVRNVDLQQSDCE